MSTKFTPLTTRPSRTSRQGMTRSGIAFGVADGTQRIRRVGRHRPDDDLPCAAVEPPPRVVDRTDAAADLHAKIACGEARHVLRLDRRTAARAFQVDDVEARAARNVERLQ